MSDKNRLVYSSDGSHLKLCKKCHENPCICENSPEKIVEIHAEKLTLKMRIEKNGRGGKIVTLLYGLPFNPPFFEELTKKLKNHCGTGGTFKSKEGQIEIQGDHREKISAFLMAKKIKIKGG